MLDRGVYVFIYTLVDYISSRRKLDRYLSMVITSSQEVFFPISVMYNSLY
jgi:hypothetical protein